MKNVTSDILWNISLHVCLTFMYFLYYFLVPISIISNLSFLLNHERHYLKIYGVFQFMGIFTAMPFFSVKMGYFLTFILEFNLSPIKKLWHVIYRWIQNFKKIMNIKLSFAKNDMGNFDYALTFKKKLGCKLFTICTFNFSAVNSEGFRFLYTGLHT